MNSPETLFLSHLDPDVVTGVGVSQYHVNLRCEVVRRYRLAPISVPNSLSLRSVVVRGYGLATISIPISLVISVDEYSGIYMHQPSWWLGVLQSMKDSTVSAIGS